MIPRYPIYVLSKGRYDCCLTAKFFIKDNVKFYLVIEEQEYQLYKKYFPNTEILILPKESSGRGAIHVRNWIWSHSIKNGYERHWEFDDNISLIRRLHKGKRIPCNSNTAISIIEDFTDRYTNIAISGFNYTMFVMNDCKSQYYLNCHVYSGMLIKNQMPYRWRLNYNADTDLCLQVLNDKYCTVSFNQFMIDKMTTMKMKGGNTKKYSGNGRLKMAKLLEFTWPQYVKTTWKFNRPQHSVAWKKFFKHNLIRRQDINWEEIKNKKYEIKLQQINNIKSNSIKKYIKEYNK
jgi:hypothetical protein